MAIDDPAAGGPKRRAGRPRSHLFTVRLWKEEVVGGSEWRGTVRDAVSGAFRSFRHWPEVSAFMAARIEEEASARSGGPKEGPDGDAHCGDRR